MKLTTISATYGRKQNLGDYNSAHVEISLWADLDDGDDEAAAAEALRNMARAQVMLEMVRIVPDIAAKVENIFAGLPTDLQSTILGENDDAN